MAKSEKIMVTEHMMEVRHAAIGRFIDVRGGIADRIRSSGFLPHWKIDSNLVVFADNPEKSEIETSFVGYKSFGYSAFNPPTKNFFQDRSRIFLNSMARNGMYAIPTITRFGVRAKVFIPCDHDFDTLNKLVHDNFLSATLRDFIANQQTDVQIVSEFTLKPFNARISFGPMHKDEVRAHMSFESEHFSQVGLYFDIDLFTLDNASLSKMQSLLKEAMTNIWKKSDGIAHILGV
jgi:hypothetical protein